MEYGRLKWISIIHVIIYTSSLYFYNLRTRSIFGEHKMNAVQSYLVIETIDSRDGKNIINMNNAKPVYVIIFHYTSTIHLYMTKSKAK